MYVTRVMEKGLAEKLAVRAYLKPTIFVRRDDASKQYEYGASIVKDAISPTGEASKFKILERSYVDEYFPELAKLYATLPELVGNLYRETVITSPFFRSSINMNLYSEEGDCHAAHTDSNPIANLLCLHEGTPLQVFVGDHWEDRKMSPGQLLTFNGRENTHRVPPCAKGDFRLIASMNLYFPDDCYRPEGLDEIAYGES